MRWGIAAAAILASLWAASLADPTLVPPVYEITDASNTILPSDAYAVSPSGSVVGAYTLEDGRRVGFQYDPLAMRSEDRFLSPSDDASTVAWGINAFCEIAGTATPLGGQTRAILRDQRRQRIDLSARLGGAASQALGINDRGDAVGSAVVRTGREHAILWRSLPPNQPPSPAATIDLGTLGGAVSVAQAINNAGQVVGLADTSAGQRHAFLWTDPIGGPARMRDLGALGGATSEARAINAAGQVVGGAATARGNEHAFRWTSRGMEDLGTLGGRTSAARAINSAGQIVGTSETAAGQPHAFLYTDGTGMVDLNRQIEVPVGEQWELLSARAINDVGWIVGMALYNGRRVAFLLKPMGGQTPPDPPRGSACDIPDPCNSTSGSACGPGPVGIPLPLTRFAVFRPSTREWTVFNNPPKGCRDCPPMTTARFGEPGSTPYPADYRGTTRAQLAVVRLNTARNKLEWTIRKDDRTTIGPISFGDPGDQPVPADYLKLGHAQIAVYRPSTGQWWVRRTLDPNDTRTVGPISLGGQPGDVPVPAAYLYDEPDAIAVFRPSTADWLVRRGSDGKIFQVRFGKRGDLPVPADYMGNGRTNLAVVRPNASRGTLDWYIRDDAKGPESPELDTIGPIPFGRPGDTPVPGAYRGTAEEQIAVFRPATSGTSGFWLIQPDDQPDAAPVPPIDLGHPGDQPVPAAFPLRLGR